MLTATGTLELVVELLPRLPLVPLPQQYALLSEAMAQVCRLPAEICLIVFPASTPVMLTAMGTLELAVELLPNCPALLLPQQYALLSEAMAQVCRLLAEICLIVFPASTPEVLTATGTLELAVELLPNCPALLLPQQYALLSEAMAQVCRLLAEICLIVFPASTPEVLTATGTLELVVELLPSLPPVPLPQQYALSSEAMAQVYRLPAEI